MSCEIDKKGAFECRGVPPGSYNLLVWATLKNELLGARLPIPVGDSNIEKVEVTLSPAIAMTGRLKWNGDVESLTNAIRAAGQESSITLSSEDSMGGPIFIRFDENFAFSFKLMPGPYGIFVGVPTGYYVASIRLGDQELEGRIEVTEASAANELTITISNNGGKIDGLALDEESEPALGATVVLVPESSHRSLEYLYKLVRTDQHGRFMIPAIRPGDYKVFAWKTGSRIDYRNPDVMKTIESKGEAVSVKENGHVSMQVRVLPADVGPTLP